MPANEERGEHELVLAGAPYLLRPSFGAVTAIEKKTGASLIALTRLGSTGDLTYAQIGVIAAELIRAGAEDELTKRVSPDRIAELVFEEGLGPVMATLTLCMVGAVNGGRLSSGEAKAPAAAPGTGKAAGAE